MCEDILPCFFEKVKVSPSTPKKEHTHPVSMLLS